jgi:hypothetical protein
MTLEERVSRLEAIEAIRRLKARYAHAADAKYTEDHRRRPQEEIDRIARVQADCFTADAVWEGGPQWGGATGREAIYAMVRRSVWSMTMHYLLMPDIEVTGQAARATWYQWQVGTWTEGERPILMAATTEDEYRMEDGEWRISRLLFRPKFMTPFDEPWSRRRNAPWRP